jgi:hypothetical protein
MLRARSLLTFAVLSWCSWAEPLTELVKSEFRLESSYATNNSHFAAMVAIDGDRLAAATRRFASDTNFIEVFHWSDGAWKTEAVFGFAETNGVASLDLSGDRLAVGMDLPAEVRVYERAVSGWFQRDTINFEGRAAKVSVSGDSLAVLTASRENKGQGTFIYELDQGEWRERFATNRTGGAIDTDGETVVVGSPTDPRSGAGSVMVYSRMLGVWQPEVRIQAPDFMLIPFGTSVAVSGARLVVGASFGRFDEGEAFVYRKASAGHYVTEAVLASGVVNDFFGQSVAISGRTIAVGAPIGNNGRGAVYLFRLQQGEWVRTQLLPSANVEPVADFGAMLAFDGTTLAVGAPGSQVGAMTQDAGVMVLYGVGIEGPYILSANWQPGQGGRFVLNLEIVELNRPHRIEYKANLSDNDWLKLFDFSPDTGSVTVLDATATNATRFYRVVTN